MRARKEIEAGKFCEYRKSHFKGRRVPLLMRGATIQRCTRAAGRSHQCVRHGTVAPSVNNYSTLMNTEAIAWASRMVRISRPCFTITKARFSGTGLFGVFTVAIPVQLGLTVYVPLAAVQGV